MTLREARFIKRLTQYDLWRMTGVTAPKLSLAERGYVSLNFTERQRLALALGFEPDQIDWEVTASAPGQAN